MADKRRIFEDIIAKQAPAVIVYEDEWVVAFLSDPSHLPGHTIVAPKGSGATHPLEMPTDEFQGLMAAVHKIAPAIRDALGGGDVKIDFSTGPLAGQTVNYPHVHILVYTKKGQYEPRSHTRVQKEELEAVGERLRRFIKNQP